MARLTPAQQTLFTRHMDGATIHELAAAAGRTSHAVEQALSSIRKRLRVLLERDGLTEAEARAYVPPPAYQRFHLPPSAGERKSRSRKNHP